MNIHIYNILLLLLLGVRNKLTEILRSLYGLNRLEEMNQPSLKKTGRNLPCKVSARRAWIRVGDTGARDSMYGGGYKPEFNQ